MSRHPAAPDTRWADTLHDLVDHHPVTALVRGVSPASVPSLVPKDWRTGGPRSGDWQGDDDPAPDLVRLLESPRSLCQLVRSQHLREARSAPGQLLRSWHRALTSLAELLGAIGPPGAAAWSALLERTAGMPASGAPGGTLARVMGVLQEHLPEPAPGAGVGGRPRYPVEQALSMVCGHRIELVAVTTRISVDIERWCDPDWSPPPPPLASGEAWSGIAAELWEKLRRGKPPTVAEAMARFVAASAVGQPVRACAVPEAWAGQVTDAAYQPLGRVVAGAGAPGAGALLTPRQDPGVLLTPKRLAYLLLIICHELDPGHAAHLDTLIHRGHHGAVLAVSRPPVWFEGGGVAAETAALDLLAEPEVEWQVRFHRLRRLVSAAMLLRVRGRETERWARHQLGRLGTGFVEPVMAGLSVNLTSVVYAYGGGVMESSVDR